MLLMILFFLFYSYFFYYYNIINYYFNRFLASTISYSIILSSRFSSTITSLFEYISSDSSLTIISSFTLSYSYLFILLSYFIISFSIYISFLFTTPNIYSTVLYSIIGNLKNTFFSS